MVGFCVTMLALCAGGELLTNGDFSAGLQGWASTAGPAAFTAVEADGRSVARLSVPAEARPGWPGLSQQWPAEEGDLITAEVEVRALGVRDGHGAYMAVEFNGADGDRISYAQTFGAQGDSDWRELKLRAIAPPGTTTARLVLLLNGRGEALFDNVRAAKAENLRAMPLDGPVTLTVTDQVVCDRFLGFGFEDDGWFYNPENAAKGVTEEDYALKEARVDWMAPDRVRMFFWLKDWCPSGDWETFTFDSPNMLSHYRTLDQYQRLGTDINVTGVEWGMHRPYADPAKAALGVAALLEHLVRDRGYTCVKYWTLTNEPNTHWESHHGTFDDFVEIHRRVKDEVGRRGLDIAVVGSDDTDGFDWFRRCVENDTYFDTADVFGSHRYFHFADRLLAPYFYEERLDLLRSKSPVKPLTIEEFGFQDARSATLENPIMMTYPYAIWTAAFAIEGLNRGVAGYCIWALHEVYYPGNGFMEYALWEFKDDGWRVRPVYYVWADFCRLTRKGDKVLQCRSSSETHVLGAVVGSTLFWVNRSDQPVEVRLEGFGAKEGFVYEEGTLHGDRDCGVRVTDPKRFTAPPMSFGYALAEEQARS